MPPGFEARALLGKGAMGRVYKAWQPKLQRFVAIKTCNIAEAQEAGQDPGRLEDEALTIARLNHPNIVSLYDVHRDDENVYLVMEFIEGAPLSRLVNPRAADEVLGPLADCRTINGNRQVMTAQWVCEAGVAVSRALTYAHARNILHRDVKPANVMITEDRHVKLLDFSIARNTNRGTRRTATGSVFGTVAYMSPEQILDGPLDGRTDIYCLGATLYHLATGEVVFVGDNEIAVCYRHVNDPPPDPLAANPDLDPRLAAILIQCLQKDPSNRFSLAAEVEEALVEVLRTPLETDGETKEIEPPAQPEVLDTEEAIFYLGAGAGSREKEARERWAQLEAEATPSPITSRRSPAPPPASRQPSSDSILRRRPSSDEAVTLSKLRRRDSRKVALSEIANSTRGPKSYEAWMSQRKGSAQRTEPGTPAGGEPGDYDSPTTETGEAPVLKGSKGLSLVFRLLIAAILVTIILTIIAVIAGGAGPGGEEDGVSSRPDADRSGWVLHAAATLKAGGGAG